MHSKIIIYHWCYKLNIKILSISDGTMILPKDNFDRLYNEIYLKNVYDKFRELKKTDIVIDIGAHAGLFTLKAARRCKLVISIEPNISNYDLLDCNVLNNKLNNVNSLNIAISNFNGTSDLFIGNTSGEHSLERSFKLGSEKVNVRTLDSIIKELNIEKVDFIKIDGEGSEYNIIKGGVKTLSNKDIYLVIEAHHKSEEVKAFQKYMETIGYNTDIDLKERIVYAWH